MIFRNYETYPHTAILTFSNGNLLDFPFGKRTGQPDAFRHVSKASTKVHRTDHKLEYPKAPSAQQSTEATRTRTEFVGREECRNILIETRSVLKPLHILHSLVWHFLQRDHKYLQWSTFRLSYNRFLHSCAAEVSRALSSYR